MLGSTVLGALFGISFRMYDHVYPLTRRRQEPISKKAGCILVRYGVFTASVSGHCHQLSDITHYCDVGPGSRNEYITGVWKTLLRKMVSHATASRPNPLSSPKRCPCVSAPATWTMISYCLESVAQWVYRQSDATTLLIYTMRWANKI